MKLKLTVLMMQGDSKHNPLSSEYLKVIVDDDGNLPSIYVSTKTIEETIQQLYYTFSNLDSRWAPLTLSDLRHGHGSTESEALYTTFIPEGALVLKRGQLVAPHTIELEDFYARPVNEQPRSLSQRY